MIIDGTQECFTLEPPEKPDPQGNGTVCISEGTYKLRIRWSWEHNRQLPHVENVPGRTAIEIHIGNYPRDVKGCTVVGKTQLPDFVGQSGVAFATLMTKLYAGGTLTNPDAKEIDQIWDVGDITYSTEV
jgi:hypothetical protein